MAAPAPTYMNVPAIAREIGTIRKETTESDMYGVWNSILNLAFPVTAGYITRPQSAHTTYSGQRGFSDFHTFEWQPRRRKYFLITQCKNYDEQFNETTWADGKAQLAGYLNSQHRTRAPASRSPVYGILAIGKRVRFYTYDDNTGGIILFQPSAQWTANTGRNFYTIDTEAHLVQAALDHIRQFH